MRIFFAGIINNYYNECGAVKYRGNKVADKVLI